MMNFDQVVSYLYNEFSFKFLKRHDSRTYIGRIGTSRIRIQKFEDNFRIAIFPMKKSFSYNFDHQELKRFMHEYITFTWEEAELIFCNKH